MKAVKRHGDIYKVIFELGDLRRLDHLLTYFALNRQAPQEEWLGVEFEISPTERQLRHFESISAAHIEGDQYVPRKTQWIALAGHDGLAALLELNPDKPEDGTETIVFPQLPQTVNLTMELDKAFLAALATVMRIGPGVEFTWEELDSGLRWSGFNSMANWIRHALLKMNHLGIVKCTKQAQGVRDSKFVLAEGMTREALEAKFGVKLPMLPMIEVTRDGKAMKVTELQPGDEIQWSDEWRDCTALTREFANCLACDFVNRRCTRSKILIISTSPLRGIWTGTGINEYHLVEPKRV